MLGRLGLALPVILAAIFAAADVAVAACPTVPQGVQSVDSAGNGCVVSTLAPVTPLQITQTLAAGAPVTIIAAGGCNHGCELHDMTGGGFYVNYTGQTANNTTTEFVQPYSLWRPPQGTTTWAVSIYLVTAGYIIGSNTP